MDISPVSSITIPRPCGPVRCGQCESCKRRAMANAASYVLRTEDEEEGDPKAALLDILQRLGLKSSAA